MTATDTSPRHDRQTAAFITFLVLGCLLSWYPWFLFLAGYKGDGGPNPLGLLVAALIAAAVAGGWRGSMSVLRSIIRARMRPILYNAAIFIPILAVAAGLFLARYQGIEFAFKPPDWGDLLDRFIVAFAFVALGEEPAWRGFLLPLLQRKLAPITATVIVAVIWAVWHVPLMGGEFIWPVVPAFLATVLGGAILLSWLYNASQGSTFVTMITHATINTVSAGYAFTLIGPEDFTQFWALYAVVWTAIGLAVLVFTRGRLGLP